MRQATTRRLARRTPLSGRPVRKAAKAACPHARQTRGRRAVGSEDDPSAELHTHAGCGAFAWWRQKVPSPVRAPSPSPRPRHERRRGTAPKRRRRRWQPQQWTPWLRPPLALPTAQEPTARRPLGARGRHPTRAEPPFGANVGTWDPVPIAPKSSQTPGRGSNAKRAHEAAAAISPSAGGPASKRQRAYDYWDAELDRGHQRKTTAVKDANRKTKLEATSRWLRGGAKGKGGHGIGKADRPKGKGKASFSSTPKGRTGNKNGPKGAGQHRDRRNSI